MAAYLIGRRQGSIPRSGALGQLVERLSPDGAVMALADAYAAAGAGRLEEAAERVRKLPLRKRGAAQARDEAVAKLKAMAKLSALRPGR